MHFFHLYSIENLIHQIYIDQIYIDFNFYKFHMSVNATSGSCMIYFVAVTKCEYLQTRMYKSILTINIYIKIFIVGFLLFLLLDYTSYYFYCQIIIDYSEVNKYLYGKKREISAASLLSSIEVMYHVFNIVNTNNLTLLLKMCHACA